MSGINKFLSSLSFLLFLCFSYCSPKDTYYQLIDEYSFNLRNKNEENQKDVMYNNFVREGDSVLHDDYLVLLPKKNNSSSFIYTKGELLSDQIELQVKFRIHTERGAGTAFAIWFFKDDNEYYDRSFVGFKNNFTGIGVFLLTPPKLLIDARTIVMVKTNNGEKSFSEVGAKKAKLVESCGENFHGRTVKITIKLQANRNLLDVYYNTPESLHYPCLRSFSLQHEFRPPFRVGISALNGMIDGEDYLDRIEIEKFTLFNMDESKRLHYMNEITNVDLNSDDSLLNNDVDLVEYYPKFIKQFNQLDSPQFLKLVNEKLDHSIIYISDLKKNLESSKHLENEKEIKKIGEIYKVYSEYITLIHDKLNNFKQKLKNIKIGENNPKMEQSNNNNDNNDAVSTSLEYEMLIREINKLKNEWENNRMKHTLSNQLNLMLSEKIDDLVKSLKLTEGIHVKLAGKLVSDKENYLSLKERETKR